MLGFQIGRVTHPGGKGVDPSREPPGCAKVGPGAGGRPALARAPGDG